MVESQTLSNPLGTQNISKLLTSLPFQALFSPYWKKIFPAKEEASDDITANPLSSLLIRVLSLRNMIKNPNAISINFFYRYSILNRAVL